jgi:hypothetical protein
MRLSGFFGAGAGDDRRVGGQVALDRPLPVDVVATSIR